MFHCIAASIGVAFQNMTNNPDQKNVILLLTRPEGGNARFCLNIEHLLGQCEILDSPLQKIEFLETLIEIGSSESAKLLKLTSLNKILLNFFSNSTTCSAVFEPAFKYPE